MTAELADWQEPLFAMNLKPKNAGDKKRQNTRKKRETKGKKKEEEKKKKCKD